MTHSTIDSNQCNDAQSLSAPTYTWGATERIRGKSSPHLVSAPGVFKATTGTLEDLAQHIGAGYAWMPSLLEPGARRWQSMANYAQLLALDIDEGIGIDEALVHPFIAAHCGLGIESNSSTPQRHKFRLIFPLNQPLEHHADIKLCTLFLQELVGSADPACKDASRFYYGAEGRVPFLLNHGAQLPFDFLEQAKQWQAGIEAEKAEQRRIAAEKRAQERARIQAAGDVDLVQLVEDAETRLGPDAFTPYLDCESKGTAEKIRCKPAFRQGSGSKSAFIAESNGKWWYHDPAGGEKALSGFWFWARLTGKGDRLQGADWAAAAKEFCTLAGIDVPDREWQPSDAGHSPDEKEIASFQVWKAAAREEWLAMRRFTPDVVIDSRYIELDREPGVDYHIKAGLGLGKTHYSTKEATAQLDSSGAVYFQAHRNSLLHQTLGRLDNPCVSMVNESTDSREYWHRLSSPACAPDSLPKLNMRDWGQTQQHIDEAAAVVKHILIGGTLASNRKQAIDIARQSRAECQSILAMDGQLTDFASDYLKSDRPLLKVEFSHKPAALDVRLIEPPQDKVRPHLPLAGILQALKEGHNCVFVADSQRDCEALDIELGGLGFLTFRYDSKTSREQETKAIVSSPTLGEDLAAMGIQVLILSPTAEAGLDISTSSPYFTKGFGLFLGIIGTDAQVQLMRRSRQTLDWDVHCVRYRAHDDVGTHSTRADTVYRYESENITLSLTTALVEAVKQGESFEKVLKHPAFALASDPDFLASCKLKAARNYEAANTFECLRIALEEDGHTVTVWAGDEDPYKDQIKDTKKQIKLSEAEKIYTNCGDPVPMPEEQARAVLRGNSASLELEYKARRTLLLTSLPGVEKTDLWDAALVYDCLYRDRKIIKCLQRFWLSRHPEVHSQKDVAALGAVLDEYSAAADMNHDKSRLDLMRELGLTALVGSFEWIDDKHPTVSAAFRRIKGKSLRRRAAALGMLPRRGETPTAWVLRMLKKLFNVATESQRRRDGDKVGRRYQIMHPKGWELYEFVAERMSQLAQERWAVQAEETHQKVIHHSPHGLKENRGVVDHPQTLTPPGFDPSPSESVLNGQNKPKTAPSQPIPLTPETPPTVTPIADPPLSLIEWDGYFWWQSGDRILPSEADPETTPFEDWLRLPQTA